MPDLIPQMYASIPEVARDGYIQAQPDGQGDVIPMAVQIQCRKPA